MTTRCAICGIPRADHITDSVCDIPDLIAAVRVTRHALIMLGILGSDLDGDTIPDAMVDLIGWAMLEAKQHRADHDEAIGCQ